MSTEKSKDEIDLLDLFSKIANQFKNLILWGINQFQIIFFFFIRNAIGILLFLLAGACLGFGIYKYSTPYYTSKAILRSNIVSNSQMMQHINSLASNFDKYTDEKIIEKVRGLEAFWEIDTNGDGIGDYVDYSNTFKPKDTIGTRINSRFILKLEVYDESIIPNMRSIILKHIDSNPYFKKEALAKETNTKALIERYNSEIHLLDSLKKQEYFKKDMAPKLKFGEQLFNISDNNRKQLYHDEAISLIQSKLSLEKQLQVFNDEIEILQDFSVAQKRANTLWFYLKKISFISLLIGLVVIFLFEQRKQIAQIIKKSKE